MQMVSCYLGNDGILYSSVSGGFGEFTYEWSNEDGEIVSITSSAENLTAQTYTFK